MNAAEEMAIGALLTAKTPQAHRQALETFVRGRDIRMTDYTKSLFRSQLESAKSSSPPRSMMVMHPTDNIATRLEAGPEPILEPTIKAQVEEFIAMWRAAEAMRMAGSAPGAMLLYGPPGTGKTSTAAWIAGELADTMATFVLDGHRWISSHLGESGSKLAQVFESINGASPAMLVLEEIDIAGGTRSSDSAAVAKEDSRITVALMRLIEGCQRPIIATTNRLDVLDPALVRRFDTVIELPEPSDDLKTSIVKGIIGTIPDGFDLGRGIVELVKDAKQRKRRAVLASIKSAVTPEVKWPAATAG